MIRRVQEKYGVFQNCPACFLPGTINTHRKWALEKRLFTVSCFNLALLIQLLYIFRLVDVLCQMIGLLPAGEHRVPKIGILRELCDHLPAYGTKWDPVDFVEPESVKIKALNMPQFLKSLKLVSFFYKVLTDYRNFMGFRCDKPGRYDWAHFFNWGL